MKIISRTGKSGSPKFSFVVPVYDRTRVVHEALKSCINQTFENHEIVVILDGSPQETEDVVRSIADSRLRVFKYGTSSGTACRGRNRGILESRSDYICFLDSDDFSDVNRLKKVNDALAAQPGIDVHYGSIKFITESNRIAGIRYGEIGKPAAGGFSLAELKKNNQVYLSSSTIKRTTLLRYGGFRVELKYREDYELWLRLKFRDCVFFPTQDVLAYYRIHDSNNELNFTAGDAGFHEAALSLYKESFTNWGC